MQEEVHPCDRGGGQVDLLPVQPEGASVTPTIEAAGLLLAGLEKRPDIAETLNASFERMLARYREVQAEMPELAPKPKKKDYRGYKGRKGIKRGAKKAAKPGK